MTDTKKLTQLCFSCDKKILVEKFLATAGIMRKWKLVRDKIPRLAILQGENRQFKKCPKKEYVKTLKEKILEEAYELYVADGECNISDVADILELIFALGKELGCTKSKLENMRQKKMQERGGYRKAYMMKVDEV